MSVTQKLREFRHKIQTLDKVVKNMNFQITLDAAVTSSWH